MLKQMPKFARIGRFLYLLRNIYLISKGKLLLQKETTGTKAYVLNTSLVNRNKRALEPEDGSIILNDINSLIEYSLEFCKLTEGIEYKVNVFDDLYHNIENDKQLLNYNGNVLYVKISETAQQNEQTHFNKNSVNNTTIKEETNEDVYYPDEIAREWCNNIGNVSSTDNGYVNSSRIIYQNNNINTSSTYMLKKSNSDKSFDSVLPYCLKENDDKKKRVLLLLSNQNSKMNGNNNNKSNYINHQKYKSNAHVSAVHNRNNSSYYIKASFYPSNTNERCNNQNQSFTSGDECYYNYSSGTVTLNNNVSKHNIQLLNNGNKPQFNSIKTETIPKPIPAKHINCAHLINKNSKINTTYSLRNNHHNPLNGDGNNNYYTIDGYNSKPNTNPTSYIPTKLFPSRGKLVLPFLHKTNSVQSIPHNNKHKRSRSISYNTFVSKTPSVCNTMIQLNQNNPPHLNKVNLIKTILFSKQPSSNTTTPYSINTNNLQLTNTKLKSIYTAFLCELRYCISHNINTIVSDYTISLTPSLTNSFQSVKSYQRVFPFKLCAKEFIMYSYLCYKCLQDSTTLNKVCNAFDSVNETEQCEIAESIGKFKCELEQLIMECRCNSNCIAKYCMDNNKMSIHKGFFVLFVLCADYFDILQCVLATIVSTLSW